MSKINNEGLTFEEWACAAGVAKFTSTTDEFVPMGKGWTRFSNCPENRNTRLMQRKYRYNYPANIRKAWADGVDPTEFRLAQRKSVAKTNNSTG